MKRTIVILIVALFIASCKKEESNPVESMSAQEKVTDYYPLEIGNYWIYEIYTSDSTLIFTDNHLIDSVCIMKDSVFEGNVFKVVFSSYWGITLIRDSSDYLVTPEGRKIFTIKQDNNNLGESYMDPDSIVYNTWKMKNSDSICIVPSGQYQAKYVIGTVTSTVPASRSTIKLNYYYAYVKTIGKVYQRQRYLYSLDGIEERLVRYKVNGKTN